MPTLTAATLSISEDEYLAGEATSEVKHEYIGGQVYAMTGASDRHGLIANAVAFALTPAVRRKQCQGGFKSEVQHLPTGKVSRCTPALRDISSSSLKTV